MVSLCNLCFDEATELDFAGKMFMQMSKDPNQIHLNGWHDGKIIAHTKITVIPTMYTPMETYAILNHFCVHPDFRRHHVAIHMLKETEKICREMGCKRINLWSRNHRIAAHALYKHYGFDLMESGFFTKDL